MMFSRIPIPATVLLLTLSAGGHSAAQQGRRETLPGLPKCFIEQGVPEKGIVDLGQPDPRSAFSLTSTAAAGQLDYGSYRWTLSGFRVRLCETSFLVDKKDFAGAKARLEDSKTYSDALVLADQAFQVRAKTQGRLCMDYAQRESIQLGQIEGQSDDLQLAIGELNATLEGFNSTREEVQRSINGTRQQIQKAIDDHNDRESSFWHQVGSFFGASSDDGIGRQLATLNGIMDQERDQLYKASLRASLTDGAMSQKSEQLNKAMAQIVQVNAHIGLLKKSINVLDDARFGMELLRGSFKDFVDEMNAGLPDDEVGWGILQGKIEALRDSIYDHGEAFPSGVMTSCDPLAIAADTKQVPW